MENKTISISTETIVKVIAILAGLIFIYLVRDVMALLFLSIIFTATLEPLINKMTKRSINRALSIAIIYIAIFLFIILAFFFLVPQLVNQFEDFIKNFPVYINALSSLFSGLESSASLYGINFSGNEFLQSIFSGIFHSGGKIFSTTVSVMTFFVSVLVIFALTFYMLVKEDGMNKFIISIAPQDNKEYIISLVERIKNKIGKWLGGQIILMLIIFVFDWIALSIFNIPYALILAAFAGILEIVPYLGPIISAILASAVGFLISPATGFTVLIVLTIIQQIESHIIVPQVMKKAVGLNPIIVMLALLIGAKLGGTLGAILSIPIATSINVFLKDLFKKRIV